jgi:hypothetical protein
MPGGVYDIDWVIKVDEGLIFLGRETNGTIPILEKNESIAIYSENIFGFGLINITLALSADCTRMITYSKGFVFGPYVYVFPTEESED